MSVIIYPPVQPGVMDDNATYTVCILARNASLISLGASPTGSPGDVITSAIDSVGSTSNAPGDMAVRFSAKIVGAVSTTPGTYTLVATAEDNAGNSVTAVQTFVARAWTTGGGLGSVSSVSGTYASGTFTVSAVAMATLSVGDRISVNMTQTPTSGAPVVTSFCFQVTALGTHTITAALYNPSFGYSGSLTPIGFSGGWNTSYSIPYIQTGTAQNDITSPASVSGTRGTPMSFTIATASPGPISASGTPAGIGIQGAILSGTPLESGWLPVVLTASTMQRLVLFEIAPGTFDGLVEAPETVYVTQNLSVAVNVLTPTLSADTLTWFLSGAPSGISLTGESSTGATVAGAFAAVGTFVLTVSVVGGTVPLYKSITFIVAPETAVLAGSANPLYLPWLHGDLSLTDLQFDLRGRGVQSFYAASGVINLEESDTCKLAVLLLDSANPASQFTDATTIWFTARTDVDTAPVIDTSVAGSSALTAVAGGSYYLVPLNLSADPVLDAINDLDDPGSGAPAVLTLHCQLAVLRGSGQTARSQPFTIAVTQRVTDAGLPALNQY